LFLHKAKGICNFKVFNTNIFIEKWKSVKIYYNTT
jgi:hypothetical protein